jgi:hypothetical protein
MHQVSHREDSLTSPVDFKLHHRFWLRLSDGLSGSKRPRARDASFPYMSFFDWIIRV